MSSPTLSPLPPATRRRRMSNVTTTAAASPAKWVNLTAICVFAALAVPACGFTPIGGLQNGEGRKLFGGYRITPKYCRGTKTLPLTDPRSTGPTICMFNHECAQRNGEVVGACMDGFLFGACCQVPQSDTNENTLIKDAQNPMYQTSSHSTEAYDSALYSSGQKLESNEFQEIQTSSTKLQEATTTQSSYLNDLVNQKIHKVNKTSTNNKIFYVNKGSVMISSPSSVSHNDDYVLLSSSTGAPAFSSANVNRVSFTTELPMKISTDLVDNEDSTQLPVLLTETAEIKKNYSSGPLDLDMGEFTHSDITHPGAESVLIDNDLQFSTGYGGPQSVYVPPPAHAEIIPPKRRPAQRPTTSGPAKRPVNANDQYVLIQTLEASKKPSPATGTTSTGISTNIDSIESIILMLNGTKHGPSYDVDNTKPNFNQQQQTYGQNQGYGTTSRPAPQTYVPVTTARPIVTVTTGSGLVLSDHVSTTTNAPTYFEESDTKRPTPSFESTEETSNKYHSVEMSDEKPSFVEIPSPPQKFVSDKVDTVVPGAPSLASYNVVSTQGNYGNPANSHKDSANPDFGYTSPAQPTSDFNKMPAVGEAYPVMDEETSAYFEASMLSEEQALGQNSQQQTDQVSDKNIPAYAQTSGQDQQQSESQSVSEENSVQTQNKPQDNYSQPQGAYYDDHDQAEAHRPQENQKRPSPQQQEIKIQSQSEYNKFQSNQNYQNRPQDYVQHSQVRPTQEHQKIRPSPQPSTQNYDQSRPSQPTPVQDYEQIVQVRPSSQRPPQNYEQIAQTGYFSHSTAPHIHIRPTSQVLTTSYEVQSPTQRPGQNHNSYLSQSSTTHIVRPTSQVVTQTYEVEDEEPSHSPRPTQQFQDNAQSSYEQAKPTTQLVTQGYDVADQSDYVSQSSEADKDTYQTPESQLIAQLTNHLNNGYLSNARPSGQEISQNGYLARPTPQGVKVQAGYLDGSTPTPIAQVFDQDNKVHVQSGYHPQSPTYEKVQTSTRPTVAPNKISTLIIQASSRPSRRPPRPTKPTKIHSSTYSDIETNYPNPTQSTVLSTISTSSQPLGVTTSKRPSKRPTKRVTKRPSTQKRPSTNKLQTAQPPLQDSYNQPPPQKFSGVPPNQGNKRPTNKPNNKKRPPSTSYVTGPTTPRPDVEVTLVHNSPPTPIADKVDSFVSSTQSPIYNSIYLASPTDEIILQSANTNSNHHNNYNNNKPLFVKIPSATQKPPSPTVIITPKPTVVNLIAASNQSKRPATTTPIPTFAGSNSYIYSPLITRRPEFASSTQEYINIPQVTSNDFDDPGYSGLHTGTTQSLNKIPTDDRPAFPGYFGPTSTYPPFQVPSDKYSDVNEEEEETYTSPNDFVNFPPVRNPNLNMSATSSSVTSDLELSTPAFVEDTILKDKMNTLVHKIVESLQDNFEALAEMIEDNNNTAAGFSEVTPAGTTLVTRRPTNKPPTRRPATKPTTRPTRVSTKKPPTRVSTPATTKRPPVTTRRPATTRKPTTKKPVTRKPTRKATTTTTAQPVQEDELVEEEEDVNNEIDANIGEDSSESGSRKFQCGVRPHVKSGRIVGGKGSTFGEFPWQVLVRESTWLGLFTKNKCGGVLITNKYVITAAHCQPGFLASLVAVMGEFDISGDLEAKRSVTKNVKRVIVHRQYDPATFENDLALLELESPVNYDTHIVPICMPADTADFTGRMATVTGWGRLKYGGGVPSVLQEVQVPIIENSVCQEMFHTAGHNKKILQSFLCAGYANGQKDSCEGDSGGPLVLQRPDGRYELAGTVSHGIKCAAPYLPGVYMRTTYYKPWLRSITGVK